MKLSEEAAKLIDEGKISLQKAMVLFKLPIDDQALFINRAMRMDNKLFEQQVNQYLEKHHDS